MLRAILIGLVLAALVGASACSRDPLPTELGWYLVEGNALTPLQKSDRLMRAGSLGHVVFGIRDKPALIVNHPELHFVIYTTNAPDIVQRIELSRLEFQKERRNIDPNLPPLFQPKGPTALNFYLAVEAVPLGVTPEQKDSRMFTLTPKAPLKSGVYALHLGPMEGEPFSPPEVYDFVIAGSDTTPEASAHAEEVIIERGACPQTNCGYGKQLMTARELMIYAREGEETDVVGTLEPKDTYDVITGDVWVRKPGIARIDKAVQLRTWDDPEQRTLDLVPKERLSILYSLGEMRYRVSKDGKIHTVDACWNAKFMQHKDPCGEEIEPAKMEWWMHVRSPSQVEGWIVVRPAF